VGDEGSPQFVEIATAEILRFAQNDSRQECVRGVLEEGPGVFLHFPLDKPAKLC
jgi:hypothetical protein